MNTRNLSGFTRHESDRIGFVVSAAFNQAISREEFREWALSIFVQHDTAPLYLMDLSEHHGPLAGCFKIIGFVPHWPFGEKRELALLGIAYLRGQPPMDAQATEEIAMRSLLAFPEVRVYFQKEFPNIAIHGFQNERNQAL